jgi:hypothetical protein
VAVHKGRLASITTHGGIRRPQPLAIGATLPGAVFELFSGTLARRTVRLRADSAVRVTHRLEHRSDLSLHVSNRLNRSADLWLVIQGRLGIDADAAVRVLRPWQLNIDTGVRTSGAHISRSDTLQHIAIPAELLADTRQILFALLIDQDHEIQT